MLGIVRTNSPCSRCGFSKRSENIGQHRLRSGWHVPESPNEYVRSRSSASDGSPSSASRNPGSNPVRTRPWCLRNRHTCAPGEKTQEWTEIAGTCGANGLAVSSLVGKIGQMTEPALEWDGQHRASGSTVAIPKRMNPLVARVQKSSMQPAKVSHRRLGHYIGRHQGQHSKHD